MRNMNNKLEKKTKILILVGSYFPKSGGVENVVYSLVRKLKQRGYEIEIITKKHNPQLRDLELVEGIMVNRISTGDGGIFSKVINIWKGIIKKRELIKKADILQFHDQATFWWTLPLFFSIIKKPKFMIFHGYESYPVKMRFKFSRWIISKIVEDYGCVSKSLENYYPVKSKNVFFNGIEKVIKNVKKEKDICFIARLDEDTYPMEYLKALLFLREKYGMEAKLDVYGDGNLRKECEEFVKANKLKVRFFGHVPNAAKKIKKYKYMFATQYLSVMEGMANRALILSMAPTKFREDFAIEILDGNNRGVVAKDYKSLARKLSVFRKDSKKYNKKIKNAVSFVETQSWDKVVDNLFVPVYSKILK